MPAKYLVGINRMARSLGKITAIFRSAPRHMMVALLLLALASAARSEAAEDDAAVQLIVNRTADAVAIYIAMPAAALPARFGGVPARLDTGPEGIDVNSLNTGTVDIADWLIARSEARLDGMPALLEPLSVMVHPTELGLPFETPRDGAIATSVCTAPPMDPRALEGLTLYAGFYLYPVDGTAPLMLRLGETAPAGSVTAANFWDWLPMGVTAAPGAPDGWIDLGRGPAVPALVGGSGAVLVAGLASLAVLGMVAMVVAPRRRGERESTPTE